MEVLTFPVQSMRVVGEVKIAGTPEQIFAALTTGVALWWGAKHLESGALARDLILEPRLGGRFYETWDAPSTDKDGALLGTVIQIRRGQILKIAGYFGMEELCAYGVVSLRMSKDHKGHSTTVHLTHDAVGEIDAKVEKRMSQFWRELLDALKSQVERHSARGLRADPAFDSD